MNIAGVPSLSDTELFWLAPQLDSLKRSRASGRLPHALLIQDSPGAGGEQLALMAAQVVLCTAADFPCGRCRDCQRVLAQSHPDLWFVAPEEDSQQIKVDRIRALNETLALTSHGSRASVAIIHPADMLNANSANALLKTLEEPRAGVLIVLVASVSARLPATVLSRCLRMQVELPPRAAGAAWLRRHRGEADWEAVLEIVGDAPLRALGADPAELLALRSETEAHLEGALAGTIEIAPAAERWAARDGFELRLHCAENWVTRRLYRQLEAQGDVKELHTAPHLPAAESSMNIRSLIRLMDALYELRRLATTTINKALAVEQLLWQLRTARKS
jgi:DNA polymerase III subunit delta'